MGGHIDTSGLELSGMVSEECFKDSRVIVWTDGACRHNQDNSFRRAGAGVFYSTGSDKNASVALDGRDQTNQRAELLAAVIALRQDPRPMEIRTDSKYVMDEARGLRHWK